MSLRNKQLDSITEADLQELVSNKVREVKTVEYKQALPTVNELLDQFRPFRPPNTLS